MQGALPPQVQVSVNPTSLLLEATVALNDQPQQQFNVDNNAMHTTTYLTSCQLDPNLAASPGNLDCTAAPTDVTEYLTYTTGSGTPVTDFVEGGFTMSGEIDSMNFQVLNAAGTLTAAQAVDITLVDFISQDDWLRNQPIASGTVGMGLDSPIMQAEQNQNGLTFWGVNIGCVGNQSFGNECTEANATAQMYVGPGDWHTLWINSTSLSINITRSEDGSFPLAAIYFGDLDFVGTKKYKSFTQLGNPNMTVQNVPRGAVLSFMFQGIGLPEYEYNQVISMIYRTGVDLQMLSYDSGKGGMLQLNAPCSSWSALNDELTFQIFFEGEDNWILVPLGAFAVEFDGVCNIYVQNTEGDMDSDIILGTLFMAQFTVYFENDYNKMEQRMALEIDAGDFQNLFGYTFLGNYYNLIDNPAQPGYFQANLSDSTFEIPLVVNSDYLTIAARASINYQFQNSLAKFRLNLGNDDFVAYGLNCATCQGTYQYLTNPYFNDTDFNTTVHQVVGPQVNWDGWKYDVSVVEAPYCLIDGLASHTMLCTPFNANITVVEEIFADYWNSGVPGASGVIGLGWGSSIWSQFFYCADGNSYTVKVSNITDWTWLDPSFVPAFTDSTLTLCDASSITGSAISAQYMTQEEEDSQLLAPTVFGFGKYYADTNSVSYANFVNQNASADLTNQKGLKFSLDYRGVGLPPLAYKRFEALLQTATGMLNLCQPYNGGICQLPGSCSSYTSLWEYSFGIQFSADSGYLVVPLGIFAAENTILSTDHPAATCDIYAQLLDAADEEETYNLQFVMGNMFFQSFYMTVEQNPQTTFTFGVNDNAPTGTFVATGDIGSGPSAFPIMPNRTVPLTDKGKQDHQMPTFAGTGADIDTTDSFFLLDFNSDDSLFWNELCFNLLNQESIGGSCADAPIYANDSFHTSLNPIGGIKPITKKVFWEQNGFKVNATSYNEPITFNERSYDQLSWVADKVYEDNWLINYGATFGLLGLGMNSPFWATYINENNAVVYGWSVNKTKIEFSNITLGSVDSEYMNSASVQLTPSSGSTYQVSGLSFGKIYSTDGVADSAYLTQLTTQSYDAQFSLSYPGLGLPSPVYQEWKSLLTQIFPDIQCEAGPNGQCAVWANCNALSDWVFQFNFTSAEGSTFQMGLPTFGTSPGTPPLPSLETDNCRFNIFELNKEGTVGTNQIVFGPQFFGEFYGEFTNQWTPVNLTSYEMMQSVQLFENFNSQYQSMIAATWLPEGANPYEQVQLSLPYRVPAKVMDGSNLIGVMMDVGNMKDVPFLLELGSNANFVYADQCKIASSLQTTSNTFCTGAPTFVTEAVSAVTSSTTTVSMNGYEFEGANGSTKLVVTTTNGTEFTTLGPMYQVSNINKDNWLYNVSSGVGGGQVSLSLHDQSSPLNFAESNLLKFSIEVGQVANQSFAGRQYVQADPKIYVGDGDYSQITGPQTEVYPYVVALSASSQEDEVYGTVFNLHQLQFGDIINENGQVNIKGQMENLGNPNFIDSTPNLAQFKLNYQGLGLPEYAWERWVSLMARANFTNQFTNGPSLQCNTKPVNGQQMCSLELPCSQYSWNLVFNLQLVADDANLLTQTYVPLSSFAVDNEETGECDLYVFNLGAPNDQPIILGTMFFQNFVAYFENDYTNMVQNVTLYISPENRLPYAFQGATISNDDFNPFNYIAYPQVWYLDIQPTFTPTVKANADFSGWGDYKLNLGALSHTVVSDQCQAYANGKEIASCKDYYNTQDVFPLSQYTTVSDSESTLMGVTAKTKGVYGNFCVEDRNNNALCTRLYSAEMQVAYEIEDNEWSFDQFQGAGYLGLNIQAGWLQYLFNDEYTGFTLQFSNFTDLSFAQAGYTPSSKANYIAFSNTKPITTTYIEVPYVNWAFNSQAYLSTKEFAFGIVYPNNTEYFQSILNSEGNFNQDSSILSLDLNGLGLPTRNYLSFVSMLTLATNGAASCSVDGNNAGCYLPKSCANYPNLWQYSFKMQFDSQNQADLFALVSLATIAADVQGVCKIFVTQIPDTSAMNSNIIIGSMFFQQLSIFMHQDAFNHAYFRLFVNPNALDSTQITNKVNSPAPSPFQHKKTMLETDTQDQIYSGIPVLSATVNGISGSPYFNIDFENSHTVFWAANCTFTDSVSTKPCSAEPLNLQTGFTGSSDMLWLSSYASMDFFGYITSGEVYQTQVCLGQACKIMTVYVATKVTADNEQYGYQGTFGILGLGPRSSIWYTLADPSTNSAQYSIALARLAGAKGMRAAVSSNITLGGVSEDPFYVGQTSLDITAIQANSFQYGLDTISFGYANGTTNAYHQAFGNISNAAMFDTVFQGLGLPNGQWGEFNTMLYNYLQGQQCMDAASPDVSCRLPGTCASWQPKLGDFNFDLVFSGSKMVMQIPLFTFAVDQLVDGEDTCNFWVQNLASRSTVVLGGMFFEEFYGQFTNTYTSFKDTQQTAKIFASQNAIYGGTVDAPTLPDGPNPFTPYVPPPPPPTPSGGSLLWLWILLGALVVVLVIVVIVIKVFKKPAGNADDSDDENLIIEDPTAAQRLTQGRVNKSEISNSRQTAASQDLRQEEEDDTFPVDRV